MQTPRPDHFTYPSDGHPTEKTRPWMRAVFLGGLVGIAALGFALTLAG